MPEKRAAMKKWNAFARAFYEQEASEIAPALRFDATKKRLERRRAAEVSIKAARRRSPVEDLGR